MPLVARVTLLVCDGLPGVDAADSVAMAGIARWATLRLLVRRMAARALSMIAASNANVGVAVAAY
jgi:hypothetical protein